LKAKNKGDEVDEKERRRLYRHDSRRTFGAVASGEALRGNEGLLVLRSQLRAGSQETTHSTTSHHLVSFTTLRRRQLVLVKQLARLPAPFPSLQRYRHPERSSIWSFDDKLQNLQTGNF